MTGLERQNLWGYALVGIGAAMFSTKAIFIKLAYADTADASKVLAFRMIVSLPFFAAIGIFAFLRARRQGDAPPALADILGSLFAGLIGYYVAMILDFEGLIYISAGMERLVLFTYPIFVMILGWGFFGERLTVKSIAAAGVTYIGLAFVFWQGFSSNGWTTAFGSGLVILSAISFAFYQLIAKGYIGRLGPAIFTSLALSGASVASVLHYAVASGGFDLHASTYFWALMLATSLVATVVPNFLVNAGMARIGPQSTAMISTISPVATIFLAVSILGEVFTLLDALGTVLIIGGIGLHTWFDMKDKPPAA